MRPLIKPLEVHFSPPYEGDNDRSYIPVAMKNGRECRLVRLEAASGGFAGVESSRLSSRDYIRDGSAESAGTGKRVIVCISTNGASRGAGNARGMRFNSGAFPSSRARVCVCVHVYTRVHTRKHLETPSCDAGRRRSPVDNRSASRSTGERESVFFHSTCKVFFDARKVVDSFRCSRCDVAT